MPPGAQPDAMGSADSGELAAVIAAGADPLAAAVATATPDEEAEFVNALSLERARSSSDQQRPLWRAVLELVERMHTLLPQPDAAPGAPMTIWYSRIHSTMESGRKTRLSGKASEKP